MASPPPDSKRNDTTKHSSTQAVDKVAVPATQVAEYARMAAEFSLDALLVTDSENRVLWLNKGFETMTGYTLDEIVGKNPDTVLRGALTGTDAMDKIRDGLRLRRPSDIEIMYYRRDGTPFWMETRITPIFDGDGRHTNFMSSSRDITARRELEATNRAAMESEAKRQRERKLLSQVSEWLYSAKSLDELLQVVSRSLETLIPEASGQLFVYSSSREILDLLVSWNGGEDLSHIDADDCWSLRRGRAYSYGVKSIEFPCHHVTASDQPYFCLPIVAHGQTNGLLHLGFPPEVFGKRTKEQKYEFLQHRWHLALVCAEQVSLAIANVQLRQELQEQSVRDPLTNLWNRRWLLETAHRDLKRADRAGKPLTVMSLDVDHFKQFNDQHGHDAGDMILRAMGANMLDFFKTDASACRIGGEEFVVLCPDHDAKEVAYLAEQFRAHISKLDVKYAGYPLPKVTVSIGIASYPTHANDLVELLSCADRAMYKAKTEGRDQLVVYEPEPTPRHRARQINQTDQGVKRQGSDIS